MVGNRSFVANRKMLMKKNIQHAISDLSDLIEITQSLNLLIQYIGDKGTKMTVKSSIAF